MFRNLVFEGGGIKGIAYVGALEVIEGCDLFKSVRRYGGVSAGAIFATMACLGYDSSEMKDIVLETDFARFLNEESGVFHELKDAGRLLKHYGWFSGRIFEEWIENLIMNRTGRSNATFRDLFESKEFGELYICTTNLSTGFGEVLSFENTPDMPVSEALRASMSIPLFFSSVSNRRGDIIVDGGVMNNYPIKLFDREKYIEVTECGVMGVETDYYIAENEVFIANHPNASPYIYNKQTLGLHLDTPEPIGVYRDERQPRTTDIKNLLDFSKVLIRILMNQSGNKHLHEDDWARSVYIDTLGIFTTEFGLSLEKKLELIESGHRGMQDYLDWFENSENHPRNCPKRGIHKK